MTLTADPDGLVDRLAAAIQSRVLSGEIGTGTRLRQESLAAEFGVSRTPVREALRKLQSTGLVEVAPNRGAIVRAPTPRDVRDSYAVRAELEGLAAELAVTLIRDDQLARLRESQEHFRHAIEDLIEGQRRGRPPAPWSNENEWERANDVFHQVIQTASGNRQLLASVGFLHRTYPRHLTWTALSTSSHLLTENVEQHQRILDAVEARDPAAARAGMAEHIRSSGELVAVLLERGPL